MSRNAFLALMLAAICIGIGIGHWIWERGPWQTIVTEAITAIPIVLFVHWHGRRFERENPARKAVRS